MLVTDHIRQEDGSYVDGATIGYNVAVQGNQATNLVDVAERCGTIRVTFAGEYRATVERRGTNE